MMLRNLSVLAVSVFALTSTAGAVAMTQASQRVVLRDRAKDPADGNYKRYPARRDLDLRRVIVERDGRNIRVGWETAASAVRSVIYTFNYFDAAGRSGAAVEVRLRADRSIQGYARKEPGGDSHSIPRSAIRLGRARVMVSIPGRFIRYIARFRWSASVGTIGRMKQIRDDVPNAGNDLSHPRRAEFP
jgi:hypothetical protein